MAENDTQAAPQPPANVVPLPVRDRAGRQERIESVVRSPQPDAVIGPWRPPPTAA